VSIWNQLTDKVKKKIRHALLAMDHHHSGVPAFQRAKPSGSSLRSNFQVTESDSKSTPMVFSRTQSLGPVSMGLPSKDFSLFGNHTLCTLFFSVSLIVMGLGQNFWPGSGQPFMVWVWIWKISPKNVKFSIFSLRVKKFSYGWVRLLTWIFMGQICWRKKAFC